MDGSGTMRCRRSGRRGEAATVEDVLHFRRKLGWGALHLEVSLSNAVTKEEVHFSSVGQLCLREHAIEHLQGASDHSELAFTHEPNSSYLGSLTMTKHM